ncbi:MAG TPA: FG-GAP-like repeat-containing protein [Pseudomonadota bacterium]|nr:FG-GAP-like repeat-containing protein [Pseudomonadota bacterium]
MRYPLASRLTIATILGVSVVASIFACDNDPPPPPPNPQPDMTVLPDMAMLLPTISSITPTMGPAAGGTAITINGTNFKPTATVKIGGVAATGVSVNGGVLSATTGASTAYGPQDVVVDNGDGSTPATLVKGYTYFLGTLTFAASANANIAAMNASGPRGLANIDLGGQGFPSLAVAMGLANVVGGGNGINLIPNTTPAPTANAPTFVATQGAPTGGTNTYSVAVGDLNGDAALDAAVVNFASSTVTALIRNGTSVTPVVITQATGSFNSPYAVAIGDFDADGKANDLAVANAGNSTVSILKNNGNNTWTRVTGAPFDMRVSGNAYTPTSFDMGDFDADGRIDLAVGNGAANGYLRVLLNKAAGWAAQPTITPAPANSPAIVKVADFNGDGKADLAALSAGNPGTLTLYQGNGTGGFSTLGTARTLTAIVNPQAMAMGDLNLDGYPDLVIPGLSGGNAMVLLGKGDGTFNMMGSGPMATGINTCYSVVIGDYNKDGKPDIAAGSYTTGNVPIFRNTGS